MGVVRVDTPPLMWERYWSTMAWKCWACSLFVLSLAETWQEEDKVAS